MYQIDTVNHVLNIDVPDHDILQHTDTAAYQAAKLAKMNEE